MINTLYIVADVLIFIKGKPSGLDGYEVTSVIDH